MGESKQLTEVQQAISDVCDEVKQVVIGKNRAYGNSALDPLRIFSKVDTIEQLNVRIDDKLSRVARGSEYAGAEGRQDDLEAERRTTVAWWGQGSEGPWV